LSSEEIGMAGTYFKYGKKEMEYLSGRDPALGRVIENVGKLRRPSNPDLFEALLSSIISQQISSKAATTVKARVWELFPEVGPKHIAASTPEAIQACGMSYRKAEYIHGLACSVVSGEFDLEVLPGLSDDELCRELSKLKGIGKWTAEMLMIFSMGRPDVLSYGDLAICRALCILHGHRKITPRLYEKYRRLYSPYASTASLYLWAIAGGAPVT
jgi:DNA-3-methyladenine glycosylase II